MWTALRNGCVWFLAQARSLLDAPDDDQLTFSCGIAAITEAGRWEPAFARANELLESAKRQGRALVLVA